MKIGDYEFETSNLDKVLYPESKITKGEIITYYQKMTSYILPHVIDRPLAMERFPDGIQTEGFYQKEVPDYFPDWIDRANVERKSEGPIEMVVASNDATLPYLANQGCIALHGLMARHHSPHKPDKIIFDLDPPQGRFDLVIKAAKALRSYIDAETNLTPYVMTTGSKGMHVAAPLPAKKSFEDIREEAKRISQSLADANNELFTTETRKNKRKGRLFLDYLRNSPGQHSIIPYSLRAIEGAPVATPLHWNEIDDLENEAQTYTMKNIFRRMGQIDDPWQDFF